jgi:hypothetical protein
VTFCLIHFQRETTIQTHQQILRTNYQIVVKKERRSSSAFLFVIEVD